MNRLIWLSGVVGVLTLAQSVQAIALKGVQLTVTGDTTYSTSSGIAAKVATVTPTTTSSTATSSTVTSKAPTSTSSTAKSSSTTAPVLSSLSTRTSGLPSYLNDVRTSYTPESLTSVIPLKNPTKSGSSSSSSSGSTGTKSSPATVPDGGATIGLLSMALFGTVVMKRKLHA